MNLTQYKALFIVVTGVLALLVASPALQRVLVYPRTEFFTELSILGSRRMAADYPYKITRNETYTVFLNIANQLGSCAYYQVQVKFRNNTQSAPNNINRTASSMPSLYTMNFFVPDNENIEIPINFKFDYSFLTPAQVNYRYLEFNGEIVDLQGYSSGWNSTYSMFYGNLIFELWIYSSGAGSSPYDKLWFYNRAENFLYHERFVDLELNMTSW